MNDVTKSILLWVCGVLLIAMSWLAGYGTVALVMGCIGGVRC